MTGFQVIGEKLHASRTVQRASPRVEQGRDGWAILHFTDRHGAPRQLPIPPALQQSAARQLRHVLAAIRAGMEGASAAAESGRALLEVLAVRQAAQGAAWLDLNVDEISPDPDTRQHAMRWLVGIVEPVSLIPLALDSSSPAVLEAGLDAVRCSAGRPLLNSASLATQRPLELAALSKGSVVLSAAGAAELPHGAAQRVANALHMVELATARGLTLSQIYLDPLVLPVASGAETTADVLTAIVTLRETLGPAVHITGGCSNISFGLPARRSLNDVFISLMREAGADSGILDPEHNHPDRPTTPRDSAAWRLAADLLGGRDPEARAFLQAAPSPGPSPSPG